MSGGVTIRSAAGSRPVARRPLHWRAVEDERGVGVLDETGRLIYTAGEVRAYRLGRFLRVLELTREQLDRLLDDERLLRTIALRHASVCWRCGRPLEAGRRVRWNTETKLARHLRSCPPNKRKAASK